MTDTTPGQEPNPDTQAAAGQQQEPEQPKASTPTQWTPEEAAAEIKALRAEAAKYRKEREAAVKAQVDAETAALAEQGKYRELFEKAQAQLAEYEPLKARMDEIVAQAQTANKRRIDAIPDAMKSLVPEYDDPLRLAAWLDANASVFAKPQAPSLDGRAGGNSGGSVAVTDEQVKAFAARFNINPDYVDRAEVAKAYNVR